MSSSVLFSCCFLVFWIAELGRLKLKHTISHVHTNGQQKKEEKEEVRWTVQLVYIKKRVYIYIYINIKQKSLFFQLLGIKYTGYILDIKYLWSFYRCQTEFVLMLNIQAIKVCHATRKKHFSQSPLSGLNFPVCDSFQTSSRISKSKREITRDVQNLIHSWRPKLSMMCNI